MVSSAKISSQFFEEKGMIGMILLENETQWIANVHDVFFHKNIFSKMFLAIYLSDEMIFGGLMVAGNKVRHASKKLTSFLVVK